MIDACYAMNAHLRSHPVTNPAKHVGGGEMVEVLSFARADNDRRRGEVSAVSDAVFMA